MSQVLPIPSNGAYEYFGEPMLWKIFEWLHFGIIPANMDVFIHPVAFAAWFGMLATALNLLPFGQLDGGHIMYAALGRRAALISKLTLATVVLLSFIAASWILMAVMLTVMATFFGFRHPRIADEDEPLDPTRRLVAIWALIIYVLCFTPVPIDILGG
jgi:membrane-associated protease RseP (regulator of RpoE activity)